MKKIKRRKTDKEKLVFLTKKKLSQCFGNNSFYTDTWAKCSKCDLLYEPDDEVFYGKKVDRIYCPNTRYSGKVLSIMNKLFKPQALYCMEEMYTGNRDIFEERFILEQL